MGTIGLLISLLTGLAGTGYGLWSMFHNEKHQEKMQQAQFDEAAKQAQINRDWSEQMQNKANAWNAPIHQVQQLHDAGLNTALMYGGSSPVPEAAPVPSGSMASPAGLSSIPFDSSMLMDSFNNVGDNMNKIADYYLKKSQLKKTDQEFLNLQVTMSNLEKEGENLVLKGKEITQSITESESRVALNKALGDKYAREAEKLVTENQQLIDSYPERLRQIRALADSYEASANKDSAQADYIREQIKYYGDEIRSRIEANRAYALQMYSSTLLNLEQKELVSQYITQMDQVIKGLTLDNNIKEKTGIVAAYVGIISQGIGSLLDIGNFIKSFTHHNPEKMFNVINNVTTPN